MSALGGDRAVTSTSGDITSALPGPRENTELDPVASTGGTTGSGKRYDQRVVTSVKLTGGATDQEIAESAFTELGWPIIQRSHHGNERDGASTCYVIEVRLLGSFARSGRAAVQLINDLADNLCVELVTLSAQPLDRRVKQSTTWQVYDTATNSFIARFPRLRRWLQRRTLGVWLAFFDTGQTVSGDHAQAEALASQPLPGAPAPSDCASIRPPIFRSEATHDSQPGLLREEVRRLAALAFVSMQGVALCGAWAAHAGISRWLPAPLAAICGLAWVMYLLLRPLDEAKPRWQTFLTCGGMCGLLFVLAWAAAMHWSPHETALSVLIPGITLIVAFGLHLLLRQWTRRQIISALVPILIPVLLPWFGGAGSLLHLFYVAEFGISPDDVRVSSTARAFASLTVFFIFTAVSAALLALWGYAKHYRLFLVDRFLTPTFWIIGAFGYALVLTILILDPPEDAARNAKSALQAREIPEVYFGVRAVPTCVRPVKELDEIPLSGGTLDPARPYVSFGARNGYIKLWDPQTQDSLSVHDSDVSLLPLDAASYRKRGACET